ncbi:T9SS type A sorting domain-containing protein [Adhaeribacter radiodurans]|uniref:T9SS type A sorting domain-containing protein n=1 Tax=Adhaeribacter radiodurans TaxID=2745197 RepID=A0A7L7LE10_9BACT|nr:T9SS type A sorting domain-containing protein [Adhaeribacter radiodurans]QMU31041.1 T9SS type A sorting domain-containing protein [Adhaeribacter radiodurans]
MKFSAPTSSIVAEREATPAEEAVSVTRTLTAYPNPFQGRVTVQFTLPQSQSAIIKVYDNQGKEITTLFNSQAQANLTYHVEWQASTKPAGLYLLQLQTPSLRQQEKLILVK